MASAYKCDRCGEFYIGNCNGKTTEVHIHIPRIFEQANYTFELCPSCRQKLFDFLENKKEE